MIVGCQAGFEIFCKSNVGLFGIRNAAKHVDVIHSGNGPYNKFKCVIFIHSVSGLPCVAFRRSMVEAAGVEPRKW